MNYDDWKTTPPKQIEIEVKSKQIIKHTECDIETCLNAAKFFVEIARVDDFKGNFYYLCQDCYDNWEEILHERFARPV